MHQSSFFPPRYVKIGDAAAFAGSTPRAIRHYHAIGLLPEPERGADGRRRYGYEDMIRLLWIRRMADAGIALDSMREAFTTGADGGDGIAGILERLEETLAEREATLRRQRDAVRRMRAEGSRMGLLSDFVTERLRDLPEGSLRPADLDNLLVAERILGPLGAALNATRYIVLATHPELRAESDRLDAAEEALDDSVAVDDPRVDRAAAERRAFNNALSTAMTAAGLDDDDAIFDAWDAQHPHAVTEESPIEATRRMPYDLSPARRRCMELSFQDDAMT